MPLQEALDSADQDMVKRLKYTKDVVATMIESAGRKGGSGAQPQPLPLASAEGKMAQSQIAVKAL